MSKWSPVKVGGAADPKDFDPKDFEPDLVRKPEVHISATLLVRVLCLLVVVRGALQALVQQQQAEHRRAEGRALHVVVALAPCHQRRVALGDDGSVFYRRVKPQRRHFLRKELVLVPKVCQVPFVR